MKRLCIFIFSFILLGVAATWCFKSSTLSAKAASPISVQNVPDVEYNESANLTAPTRHRKTPTATNYSKTESSAKVNAVPKMSIVIDDFGSYDQSGVDLLLTCKEPLTCAVMPNVDNTKQNIERLKGTNNEIILHMPMQAHVSLPESWYGPVYIANYDTPETVTKKLDKCLADFEGVRGLNIHIGSGVGRNRALMTTIYEYAKSHNLYFLDSRTIETNATVQACRDTNSIYLGRDVFLEADKNRSYSGVCSRLIEGANIALDKGTAIVIGHVGAEGGENTARAILDTVQKISDMGVKIVPLSEIYSDMQASGVMSNM